MFGFGFNKEKSRASAEKYLQQNKLQNAISEYEKILQVEPHDLAILNTVGDVYARLGQNDKAIERFRVIGESYANDGSTLKAIAMYKKITKLDPNGLAAMEKLAELYRKQGLVSDARSMLLLAAEAYTRKGQSKETLRLLKQLVLFDPENVQVITRTADLMTQGGQKNEAKQMLSQTASTLIDRHALDPALKILERLIALDRGNLRAQELRAQVTFELGDAEKAAELFELIPDLDSRIDGLRNLLSAYLKLGNLENALVVARKLVSVHQDAEGVMKVASRLYKENDTLGALAIYNDFSSQLLAHDKEEVVAHLRGAVSRVRNNPEALQMLYNLCQRAGESSMIAEILELQAHACVQNEQFERARDAYKELIELEPENSSHIQGYHQVCARISNDSPAPAITPTTSVEPRTLEEFLIGEEPELPVQNYTPEMEEVIATALTEAELCESFSSKKRGIDALEHALLSAPEDLRLNRTLALLYRQQGDPAKAAGCYVTMQRVLEGLGEIEGAAYYASAVGPDQSATTTWEAKGSEFAASDFNNSEDLAGGVGSAEEIDLSNEWESVWQEVADEPEPSAVPPFTVPMSSNSSSSASVGMSEMLEEVRFCLAQQIWSEAETGIARIAAVFPEHPELVSLRTQLWQGRSGAVSLPVVAPTPAYQPIEVIEVGSDPSSSSLSSPAFPPIPQTAVVPPAPAFTLDSLAAELDSELGDVFEPAPPHRPAATPRAVEHTAQPSAPLPYTPPPAALQPLAPPAEELVPFLAAEVAGPIAPSVFGDLLQDFEQDLAAPQDNDSDPETHFNLGIAFREMGLLDEAIGELQKVCRVTGQGMSAARAQQAYIWLATCFVEKDVPEASFKWFIRALDAAPDEDSRTAVNYELASAYEAAGRKREALDHFLEVYGTNIDYRDVASRIRELRSVV